MLYASFKIWTSSTKRVASFLVSPAVLGFSAKLQILNQNTHTTTQDRPVLFATPAKGNQRGAMSTEALLAIAACFVLVVLLALTMRDKKPRFKFDSPASPTPEQASLPTASAPAERSATNGSGLQALFDEGRTESPLIAPVEQPAYPPFVTNTDYANPPVYRQIREADLGRIYASTPQKDKRALDKVARIGGFRNADQMARSFGYPSVDQMISSWEETLVTTPRFQPNNFGTNAAPPLPW